MNSLFAIHGPPRSSAARCSVLLNRSSDDGVQMSRSSVIVCDRQDRRTDGQHQTTTKLMKMKLTWRTKFAGCHDDTQSVIHCARTQRRVSCIVRPPTSLASRLTRWPADVAANELITRNTWTHIRSHFHIRRFLSTWKSISFVVNMLTILLHSTRRDCLVDSDAIRNAATQRRQTTACWQHRIAKLAN